MIVLPPRLDLIITPSTKQTCNIAPLFFIVHLFSEDKTVSTQ